MAQVRIVSSLEARLIANGLDPNQLLQDFSSWKDSSDPDSCYIFGKDAFNMNSTRLRHVHMVPLFSNDDQEKWNLAWRRFSRRTSDRYLFYADGGVREGYLLIDILDDPGAHTIWSPANKQILSNWEEIAEKFIIYGIY